MGTQQGLQHVFPVILQAQHLAGRSLEQLHGTWRDVFLQMEAVVVQTEDWFGYKKAAVCAQKATGVYRVGLQLYFDAKKQVKGNQRSITVCRHTGTATAAIRPGRTETTALAQTQGLHQPGQVASGLAQLR